MRVYHHCLTLGVVLLVASSSLAGVPEPGLTLYGVVRANIGDENVRLTSGSLSWTILGPSGRTVTVQTSLTDILGQFSYVIEIPFETSVPGSPVSPTALELTSNLATYDRSTVWVDETLATITLPAATQFTLSQAHRGTVERVDLYVDLGYPDSDGDGMPDFWEELYFQSQSSTWDGDADADGLNNLEEYLCGSDPTDPRSVFRMVRGEATSEGGMVVRWSSMSGRHYRISRSQDLRTGFTPLIGHLPATPPENTYRDPTANDGGQCFYRIELE